MKAEDTVVDMHNPQIMPEIYHPQQELLRRQAQISFKAGIKLVVDWIELVPTREIDGAEQYIVTLEQWQAKLKEWGIDA